MTTVSEAMTFLDVMPSPTTPVAHLAIVFTPGMEGMVTNSNLSLVSSLACKIEGLVTVVIDMMANVGDGVSGSEAI